MAAIGNDPNGRKRILFVAGDGSRKTVRLGKATTKQAEAFKLKVEALVGASITGSIDDETSRWVAALETRMHARLAAAGLLKPRQPPGATTLGPFIDSYIRGRTDIKPNTLIGLGQARRNLVAFFGESRRLADITAGDAEEYWRYLIGKVAVNTARRLCGRAKQFFRFAVRKRILPDNPFAELESNVRSNPERKFFVTADMAAKVLDACPDAQWRLIFAVSRFGGLRCPSEHLALRWSDVDFGHNRLRVPSPKTEHIEGRASRVIPLFPELRKPLLEVFEQAPEGTEHVISKYRAANSNLRTQFERIIRRAGLEPWPKLFHNLRATRQTELTEIMPGHVVCAWLGNTEDVAKAHYLQVTEAHFIKALQDPHPPAKGAAQNPAQHPAELARIERNVDEVAARKPLELPVGSPSCEAVRSEKWPLSGSNHYAFWSKLLICKARFGCSNRDQRYSAGACALLQRSHPLTFLVSLLVACGNPVAGIDNREQLPPLRLAKRQSLRSH